MTVQPRHFGCFLLLFCLCGQVAAGDPSKRFVYPGAGGKLVYDADERGNRIPDFSHCGYGGGDTPVPDATIRVVVKPHEGDATERIQTAIDYVAGLKPDANGLRGAVLLLAGRHEVAGSLHIRSSGVILRGEGAGKGGTLIVATGVDRRSLIHCRGQADTAVEDKPFAIAADYVPVGSYQLKLKSTLGLAAGETVRVEHPSMKEWIAALGMDRFPTGSKGSWLDWKPGSRDLSWDRTITRVGGDVITIDAPLTSALDGKLSPGRVVKYRWPGRIDKVGVENLRLESAFDKKNPHDEEHAWDGIVFENVRDSWVRQVAFAHFAGSAVCIWESCRSITIEDCEAQKPVSELAGWRRHVFFTAGQLTLFQRCRSEQGRHDFAVGHLACGPNAFVHCQATGADSFSGPIGSWASGVLYDNVDIDGGGLFLTNRETEHHGVGWAAANSVLWQCSAPKIVCRAPPTAQNWAIGLWAHYAGDGHWRNLNQFVKPDSLFAAQLTERLGEKARDLMKRRDVSSAVGEAKEIDSLGLLPRRDKEAAHAAKPLTLKNGQLLIDGKPVMGRRTGVAWWRGDVLPSLAESVGVGVTRFVPGRVGPGFTDDLGELTASMLAKGQVVLEHHWGLWYDRRRDDHQMIRRADAEAWAPFYELPWARSGQGRAWDGLSKYDLTKFSPWYFARLKQFADLCDREGLVLVQQMYFQHNLLEAGAHWADFPWRPANCLQATGFPEPPPYVGKKRIFMAQEFYDVTHPVRRELHRAYIRHCLDVLGTNTNVVFQTGEEFTGPLEFVRFWLDTIAEWEKEKGRSVRIGLSCTRDVQDAILADAVRAPRISIIDMRYWWYTAAGGVYDPKGGENLAPRQQLREWKGSKTRSNASIARQIREYRQKHPDKAVVCSFEPASPWAVMAAGGSIANLPATCDNNLLAALPRMNPWTSKELAEGQLALADPGRDYLVFAPEGGVIRLDLAGRSETFAPWWVNLKTGEATRARDPVSGGGRVEFRSSAAALLWLTKK